MSPKVIRLPQRPEALPLLCETCSVWDIMTAHFFLYDDGSFRCVNCGTGYEFVLDKEKEE